MSAQIDDLLRNRDITWVAEVYNDFIIDESFESKVGDGKSRSTSLKLVNKSEDFLEDKYAIQKWLMAAVENKKVTAYSDSDCRFKINPDSMGNWSMLPVVNPHTQKTDYVEQIQRYGYEDITAFRARQIIYYDSKKAKFGMRTLAVALISSRAFFRVDKFKMMPKNSPVFWFKPKDLIKTHRLSETDITWAKRMHYSGGIELNADSIKVLKKTSNDEPISSLFQAFSNNPKISFYKEGFGRKEKWHMPEREGYLMARDTMIDMDAYNNEHVTKFKIVAHETKAKDIHRLGLVQNWYWNDKKQQLEIFLVATAPLKDMKNDIGEFLYWRPLFYQRTDDD